MATEISLSREDIEAIESRAGTGDEEESRFLSFLANRYRSEEAAQQTRSDSDPNWIFNIWTYRM
jgi:hypothetical protein